jgi:uncharacterized protein YifE (UPF0438 family)
MPILNRIQSSGLGRTFMVENAYRLPDEYRRLLRAHFAFYRSLAAGEREALTEGQRHFVDACRGRASPKTAHEFAYTSFRKYCALAGISEEEAKASDFTFPPPNPMPPPRATAAPLSPEFSGEVCPRCAKKGIRSALIWRHARDPNISGEFLGCSRFPHCQYIDK